MLTLVLDGWAFEVFVLAFFNLLFMSAGPLEWTSSLRPGKTDLWSHCSSIWILSSAIVQKCLHLVV